MDPTIIDANYSINLYASFDVENEDESVLQDIFK